MTRLLVTGARDWADAEKVHHELNRAITRLCPMYPDGVDWDTRGLVLVHGACPTGADYIAKEWAIICLAFIGPKSRGTVDCADKAAAAGIETLRWYA
jgi:hypothetical protein